MNHFQLPLTAKHKLMKNSLIAMGLSLCALPALAEQNMDSVMFKQTQSERSELTSLPADNAQSPGSRCEQMAKEIDSLEGKPQRRSTLMARYRAECEINR